ncbi:MAG TPA: hypothetical protein VGO93_24120 [Candidatus Xenobia bacterium]
MTWEAAVAAYLTHLRAKLYSAPVFDGTPRWLGRLAQDHRHPCPC